MMRSKYSIGIDLGATKILAGIVDSRGKILHSMRIPSKAPGKTSVKDAQLFLRQQISHTLSELIDRGGKKNLLGVGISAAGPLDVERGELIHPTNFPGWKIVPLKNWVEVVVKKMAGAKPVKIQNDAMAAALGEGWVGRARGLENYALITLGTGIGTGVIHRNHPTQFQGMGGEWGHQIISLAAFSPKPTNSYNGGPHHLYSIEGFASGTGILFRAKQQELAVESVEDLLSRYPEHPITLELFREMGMALGILCYNLSLGLRLQKILFGGGMAALHDRFLSTTKSFYADCIQHRPGFQASIGLAKLGNQAGLIGAARLLHKSV